ncbi:MAG: hypothetical protein HWN80_04655 [Candidatus Lokiarchaeota archaeon]|nr:hypothetical protein [Candidatus Lokiarchaeota archaeon]
MARSQENEDFEQVVEKIVFDEEELNELKITIRNFTEGKIQAKQLKQKLLQSRGRMVKDISNFLSFCIERIRDSNQTPDRQEFSNSSQAGLVHDQLQQDIAEKNELLEVIAKKIDSYVSKAKKLNIE